MNKTLAGFFGIKAAAEIVTEVVEAIVAPFAGADAAETKKELAAEGTPAPGTPERADEITPTVAETVTGEDTDTPVDATVGEDILPEEVAADGESAGAVVERIEGEEFEVAPGVEMAGLPVAELDQIRADAASWNAHKGEFAVLQNWYKNTTGGAVVGATVDAADAVPGKKKSWESAAWNN